MKITPRAKLLFLGYLFLLLLGVRDLPNFRFPTSTNVAGWCLIVFWSLSVLLLPWLLPWLLRLIEPVFDYYRWIWLIGTILTPVLAILDPPSNLAYWLIGLGQFLVMGLGAYFFLIDKAVDQYIREMQSWWDRRSSYD